MEEIREYSKRKPWVDGCIFNRVGVVCKDERINCARCGWCPAEANRRIMALREKAGAAKEGEGSK